MGTHRFKSRGVFGNEHACVWNTSRLLEYKCAKCKIKNRLVLSADKECKLAVRLFPCLLSLGCLASAKTAKGGWDHGRWIAFLMSPGNSERWMIEQALEKDQFYMVVRRMKEGNGGKHNGWSVWRWAELTASGVCRMNIWMIKRKWKKSFHQGRVHTQSGKNYSSAKFKATYTSQDWRLCNQWDSQCYQGPSDASY